MIANAFGSVQNFLEANRAFLMKREDSNNVLLSVCSDLLNGKIICSNPLLLSVIDPITGEVFAAAVQAPSLNNLLLSHGSEKYLAPLIKILEEKKARLMGALGPAEAAQHFSTLWSQLKGFTFKPVLDLKLYKLTKLNSKIKTTGSLKKPTPKDQSLVTKWFLDFVREATPGEAARLEKSKDKVLERIKSYEIYLLIVEDEVVSMCGTAGSTENGIRIAMVYTPVGLRRRGHASSMVAQLSQELLANGRKFCVLFTDSKNPTSNRIYQDIGYELLCDFKHILFEEAL